MPMENVSNGQQLQFLEIKTNESILRGWRFFFSRNAPRLFVVAPSF